MILNIIYLLVITLPLIYFPFSYNPLFIVEIKWGYGVCLTAVACALIIGKNIRHMFLRSTMDIALLCLFVSHCISVIFSFKPQISVYTYIFFFGLYGIYFIGSYVRNMHKTRILFLCMTVGAFIVSLYYFLQQCGFDFLNLHIILNRDYSSTFSNANNLAGFLVFVLPISLCYFLYVKKIATKVFYGTLFLFMFTALFFTQTRASWVGILVALMVSIILIWKYLPDKKYRKVTTFVPIFIGIGIVISALFISQHDMVMKRITSFRDSADRSMQHRSIMWRTAGDIIRNHWLCGAGLGMYEIIHPHNQSVYLSRDHDIESLAVTVHNDLLESAVDGGIIGLFSLLFLISAFIVTAIKKLNDASLSQGEKENSVIILSSCVALLVYGLFHSSLRQPVTALYFFLYMGMMRPPSVMKRGTHKRKGFIIRLSIIVLVTGVLIVCALRPVVGNSYFGKAATHKKKNDMNQALAYYQKAQAWKPYDYKIYINKGNIYMQLKEYDDAISEFERSLTFHPYSVNAHNSLAVAYYSLKQYADAKKYFENAVALNPNFFGAYFNNGLMHLTTGKTYEAIPLFEKARDIKPNHILTHFYLGGLYRMTKNNTQFNAEKEYLQNALAQGTVSDRLRPLIQKLLQE